MGQKVKQFEKDALGVWTTLSVGGTVKKTVRGNSREQGNEERADGRQPAGNDSSRNRTLPYALSQFAKEREHFKERNRQRTCRGGSGEAPTLSSDSQSLCPAALPI